MIVIDPARELSGYEYSVDGDGRATNELPDKDNHLIDALRYATEPLMERRSARTLKGLY